MPRHPRSPVVCAEPAALPGPGARSASAAITARSRPPSSSRPAEARGRHLVPGAGPAIAWQRRRVRRSPGGRESNRDSKGGPGPKSANLSREHLMDFVSLRALYGTDELRNGLHGSLSISSAEKEIRFIFPEAILEPLPTGQRARDYLNLYVKPTLLAGLTALCKERPADPMIWLADWLIEHNPNKPKLQYHISQ
ncbi:nucleoside diphosphate kinase homolog 5 isoform 2-T4 [Geothlypis trichas]